MRDVGWNSDSNDISGKIPSARLRRSAVWAGSAACRVVGEPVGTHDARSTFVALRVRQRLGTAPGLEVSPGNVLEDLLIQAEFAHQPLQLAVFLLQFLQPLGLVHLQAAVLLALAVVGLFRDTGFPAAGVEF